MTQAFRKGIQYYSLLILIHMERIFTQHKLAVMTRQHLNLTQLVLKFLHTGFSKFKMYAYVRKVRTFTCIKPSLVLKCKVTGFL